MDLSTMKRKVDSWDYGSFEELEADFELMCRNCTTYNVSPSVLIS